MINALKMDLTKLKIAFKTLDELDETDELAYEKALITFNSINHLPVFINTIEAGVPFFRTRTHESKNFFELHSEIAVTPQKFVKEFARCNRPYQSIFYCSENRPTSFMELVQYWAETKNFGDNLYVTVGMWENTKPLNVIIVTTPDKSKRLSNYDNSHGEVFDEHLKGKSAEEIEFSNVFYDYMFERFRKPSKQDFRNYLITTAYTNIALTYAKELADGISYPSVPFSGKGVNFAIKENFSTNYLKLTHANWLEFEITKNKVGKHTFKELNSIFTDKIDIVNSKIICT